MGDRKTMHEPGIARTDTDNLPATHYAPPPEGHTFYETATLKARKKR